MRASQQCTDHTVRNFPRSIREQTRDLLARVLRFASGKDRPVFFFGFLSAGGKADFATTCTVADRHRAELIGLWTRASDAARATLPTVQGGGGSNDDDDQEDSEESDGEQERSQEEGDELSDDSSSNVGGAGSSNSAAGSSRPKKAMQMDWFVYSYGQLEYIGVYILRRGDGGSDSCDGMRSALAVTAKK